MLKIGFVRSCIMKTTLYYILLKVFIIHNACVRANLHEKTTIKPSITIFNILQHKEIECRSYFGKYSECVVGGPIKFIYFRKQLTSNECKVNQTYGTIPDHGVLWVNKDCSGLFDIYYEILDNYADENMTPPKNSKGAKGEAAATSNFSPTQSYGHHKIMNGGGPGREELKTTFSNEYKSVICESRGRRSECELFRNISSLRLLRQLSWAECSRKSGTYGHYGNRVWVDRGCRAKFEVRFKLDEEYYYSLISDRRASPDQRVLDDFLFCASPPLMPPQADPKTKYNKGGNGGGGGGTYRECPLRAPTYEAHRGNGLNGQDHGTAVRGEKFGRAVLKRGSYSHGRESADVDMSKTGSAAGGGDEAKSVVVEKFKLLKSLEAASPCIFNVTYGINVKSLDPEDDLIYQRYQSMLRRGRANPGTAGQSNPYRWLISTRVPKMGLPPRRSASFVWVRGCAAIFQLRIKVKSRLGYMISLPSEYRNGYGDSSDQGDGHDAGGIINFDKYYGPDAINHPPVSDAHSAIDYGLYPRPKPLKCEGNGAQGTTTMAVEAVTKPMMVAHATFTSVGGFYGRWSFKNDNNSNITESNSTVSQGSSDTNSTATPKTESPSANASNHVTTVKEQPHPGTNYNGKSFDKNGHGGGPPYVPDPDKRWGSYDGTGDGDQGSDSGGPTMIIREYITFCGSGLAEYRECSIGKIILGIKVYRQIPYNFQTHTPDQYPEVLYGRGPGGGGGAPPQPTCTYQKTFGYRDQNIWVANGCQAIFTVYLPDDTNLGNGTASTPNKKQTEYVEIVCQSRKGRNECPAPGNVISIALVEEYSPKLCYFGETFGHYYSFLWVDDGCQGRFRASYVTSDRSHYHPGSQNAPDSSKDPSTVNTKGSMPFICQMELMAGNCSQNLTRYFFDVASGNCLGFSYTGCGGNDNNFLYLSHCQRTCETDEFFPCLQPPEIGNCSQYENKYFYSPYTSRCESFTYSGCLGNYNRFSTLEECASVCDILESICTLLPDEGNGSSIHIRYFYNPDLRRCQQFVYTGNGGNGNRFKTEVECMKRCVGEIAQHGEISLTCASYDFTHKECDLGIPVVDLIIERRLSIFPCEMDVTYGMIGSKVWVFQGCSARFRVRTLGIVPLYVPAFTPNQGYGSGAYDSPGGGDDKGNGVGGWNNGYNGFNAEPIPNDHEMVTCASINPNQLQICPLEGSVVKISLFSELSQDVCVEGKTYGRQTDNLWVFNGCQAQFLVWKQ